MIEVRNLSYSIGSKKLLRNINFNVQSGDLLTVIGANGAGKSTLLKLLAGELQASEGDILIRQKSIATYKLNSLARFRSVLAQSNTITVSFKVNEIVMMGRYVHFESSPTDEDIRIVHAAMQQTGVLDLAYRDYNTLSGGEQQRVQLARVIAQIYDQPNGVLFLDEPTTGLDLLYQQQILSVARELADRGYCVVSILHDINFASRYADKVLILKDGHRVAFGTPNEVINIHNIQNAFNIRVRLLRDSESDTPLVIPATILSDLE